MQLKRLIADRNGHKSHDRQDRRDSGGCMLRGGQGSIGLHMTRHRRSNGDIGIERRDSLGAVANRRPPESIRLHVVHGEELVHQRPAAQEHAGGRRDARSETRVLLGAGEHVAAARKTQTSTKNTTSAAWSHFVRLRAALSTASAAAAVVSVAL